jgi:N-acetylglucosamine repressor
MKATQQQTREHNRNLALDILFERPSVSRAEISRITGLTRTTISGIVNELIRAGLVHEVGLGKSRGGKSPILLSLIPDSRSVIGLDLAYDTFSGAVVNLRGKILRRAETPVRGRDGDAALASVYELLDELVPAARQPLVGIGVGTPGLVSASCGVVVNAVNLDWRNLPLRQLLQDRYHVPVTVVNDSQAAAVGEHTFGEGHRPDGNLILVNVRHGIGAGIIIRGELFHGDGGGAGEIGHVVVVREGGLPCRCGNSGCLETVASTRAVVQRAQMLARHFEGSSLGTAPEVTFEGVRKAFAAGDPVAQQVVREAGRFMGMAISSLMGTLNIQRIVLAGGITSFGQPLLDVVNETVSQTMLTRLVQDTRVEFEQLGHNEIVLGACAVVLKDYSLLLDNDAQKT